MFTEIQDIEIEFELFRERELEFVVSVVVESCLVLLLTPFSPPPCLRSSVSDVEERDKMTEGEIERIDKFLFPPLLRSTGDDEDDEEGVTDLD